MILDGRGLTPGDVDAVARGGAKVVLDDGARERNSAAAGVLNELLGRGEPVYGVTTGVGPFRTRPVPPEQRSDQQRRLLRSHASGGGPVLAPERVRAAMVVRANQLGAGGAGVSDALLDALVDALNDDFTPVAHEVGSLGTGDLTVLAEIALGLVDHYSVELGPRDGIAFMSSNAEAIGHAALVATSAARLLDGALGVAALSFLGAGADPVVLDARVHDARPHPGQVAVARGCASCSAPMPCGQGGGRAHPGPVSLPGAAAGGGDRSGRAGGPRACARGRAECRRRERTGRSGEPAVLPNANFHAGRSRWRSTASARRWPSRHRWPRRGSPPCSSQT